MSPTAVHCRVLEIKMFKNRAMKHLLHSPLQHHNCRTQSVSTWPHFFYQTSPSHVKKKALSDETIFENNLQILFGAEGRIFFLFFEIEKKSKNQISDERVLENNSQIQFAREEAKQRGVVAF